MTTPVIVFAKAPVAGLARTRLAPALGADGAAALDATLLRQAAQALHTRNAVFVPALDGGYVLVGERMDGLAPAP